MTYETEAMAVDTVVKPGVTFRQNSASGLYVSRVLRPHRDHGYWETVITEGGHPALVGSIQIVSTITIYRARAGRDPLPAKALPTTTIRTADGQTHDIATAGDPREFMFGLPIKQPSTSTANKTAPVR